MVALKCMPLRVFPIAFLSMLLVPTPRASGQNFSGLQGKELARVADVGSLLEGGLGKILGGDKVTGAITKVAVLDDSEQGLTLAMDYSGLAGAFLKAEILNSQKRVQREISCTTQGVLGQDQPLKLVFSLSGATPEGAELQSAFLKLTVSQAQGKPAALVALYGLQKNWKHELNPENVVVTLTMDPVNTAGQLRPNQPTLVVPVQVRKIDRKIIAPVGQRNMPAASPSPSKNVLRTNLPTAATVSRPDTAKMKRLALPRYTPAQFPTQASTQDKNPLGPDNSPISLWDDLVFDGTDFFTTDLSNIQFEIYPDKNLASGIFYYLPARYCLDWNAVEGYKLDVLYGSKPEEGKTESVQMHFALTPAIYSNEIQVVNRLMDAYKKANPGLIYSDLRILPTRETPQLSLQTAISSLYDIATNKISVNPVSSLREPIQVALVADSKTMNEIQTSLAQNIGLNGTMTIKPKGEALPDQTIPVTISLGDEGTFGHFDFNTHTWRQERWRNQTPYPLRLRYMNVLMIKQDGPKPIPIIYSWKLRDTVVPPQAQVAFDGSTVPLWLDTDARNIRMWLDYSVESCNECTNSLIAKHWHSPSSNLQKQIGFTTFKLFDSLNVDLLMIKVRSRQATPDGKTVLELSPIKIDKDREEFKAGPLYVPEGQEVAYEYQLTLVMKDGDIQTAQRWIQSNEASVLLGVKKMKELFPAVLK